MKQNLTLFVVLILMAGCVKTKTEEKTKEKTILVNTSKVEAVSESFSLKYSGSIEASQTIPLSFETTGTVNKIFIEVGDAVKKGQKLASIDNSNMQNIYNTMLAKFKQAQDAYDRLKVVHDEGSLPEIKWVEMESNYEQAKSALEMSKNNLEKCTMISPADGFIGRRNIEPGQSSIGISMAPIELVKIETVHIKISVPENEIGKIKMGMKATITISALGNKSYEGTITNVGVVADRFSRTYDVKIAVKNADLEMKPGMVCDVTLNTPTENELVIIPYSSVSKDTEGNTFVYLVSPDKRTVKKQIIEIGNYQSSGVEVLDGLALNQIIVVEGKEKLSDNSVISL